MFIPVLVGTGREGNYSTHAAKLIIDALKKANIETELVTPKDYLVNPFTERLGKERSEDEKGKKFQDTIKRADKIIVVTPEYNRSYPGELKLMIDMLYSEYVGKEFYIVGVSSGQTGGARAVEAFMHVVVGVEGIPHKPRFYFSSCEEIFSQSGELKNKEYIEKADKFVSSLI